MGRLSVLPCLILMVVMFWVAVLIEVGAASIRTLKVAVAFSFMLLLTLMVAVPGFLAVTTPLEFTLATLVLELVQLTPVCGVAPALWVKFSLFPRLSVLPISTMLDSGLVMVILVGALLIHLACRVLFPVGTSALVT